MFKNFIRIAFRWLLKNKTFAIINILGLALGFTICLLFVFYVVDELSYNRFNTNANRIYRINMDINHGCNVALFACSWAHPVKSPPSL